MISKKYILLMLLSTTIAFASDFAVVTSYNIDKLVNSLAKSFGLEKTIRTIIRIESNDGQYMVNLNDPSCGISHIHLKTYLKRHNIKDTPFNRNKHCQELINNPKLAIANAIEEILFWKSVHCSKSGCDIVQYQNVVKSYNAGWNYSSKKANEYYKRFKKVYKELYGN